MGGSAKGGGQSNRYNYHGTIAGLVCAGLVTKLKGIEIDDEMLWTGSILEADSPNPVEITVPKHGLIRFYWGRDDQTTPDPALVTGGNTLGHDHPAYTGLCYFVAVDFLFGLEKTSAPSIRIHVEREPVQSLITGPAAANIDGQANPFAVLAELYQSERIGLGLPASMFDASSWQDAADACYAAHAKTYISPLLTDQVDMRSLRDQVLALCDGYVRPQLATGLAEAGLFTPPELIDPDALPLIDAASLVEEVDADDETIDDVYTRCVVTFRDRNKNFKERPAQYDDPSTRRISAKRRTKKISAPFIVRYDQALAFAQRMGSRLAIPGSDLVIEVRPERAMALQPGQHIVLDVDPEPGSMQRRQVCRITKITRRMGGATRIELEAERQIDAAIYTPTSPTPPEPPAITIPDVSHVRFFEAPYALAGGNAFRIGVLASRPDAMVTSFRVHYDDTSGGDFPPLGDSRAYALRARLNTNYADSDTGDLSIEILDTINREIIDENPGDTAARDDALLLIVLKIAGSGQIEADGDGRAWMEIFSVSEIVSTAPNIVDVTAMRARQGTTAHSFLAGAEAWFIRRSALTILSHADFAALAAADDPAYFKLQPSGPNGERPLEDCTQRSFSFALVRELPPVFPDDGLTPDPVSDASITPGFNTVWIKYTLPTNTRLRGVRIYESTTTTRPSNPILTVAGTQNFAVREGLPDGVLRYYWIECEAENGRLSSIIGPLSTTTLTPYAPPAGFSPPTVVSSLPNVDNFQGRLVLLTTDNKLYRWTHASETTGTTYWTAAVAAADVSGQLSDAQIAALAASKITGTLTNSQIADLAAAKLTGQITETQITDNAISTSKLAATAVTTEKLAATAVTAEKIAASAITAEKVAAGAIETAKLAAGAVVADKIAANAITASKLTLINADSVIPDSGYYDLQGAWGLPSTPAIVAVGGSESFQPARFIRFDHGAGLTAGGPFWGRHSWVESGAAYRVRVRCYLSPDVAGDFLGCIVFNNVAFDAAGIPFSGTFASGLPKWDLAAMAKGEWLDFQSIQQPSSLCKYIHAAHEWALTAGYIEVHYEVVRAASADLIVDGAVVADKIAANAVTAGKIAAGAVEADKIAANAVTAEKINAGAVTADKIDTAAVTTNKLSAGAVTADKMDVSQLSAITATIGTLQPATSGQRFKLTTNGFEMYDASNVVRFRAVFV